MSARRRTQLICSAMFGALVISCAAPPVYVVAPPAPQAQQEQRGGEQAEQAPVEQQPQAEQQQRPPVEQQQPAQPPVVVLPPPVVSQPGPASQGGGAVGQVPDPGSQSRQPTGGQRRPSGNAPGVRHDIPKEGDSDLSESDNWKQSMHDACADAGVRDSDCPTFDIQVFANGKRILNPGTDYRDADPPQYDSCLVKSINPPSPQQGGPKLVSAGSVIKVKVVCNPVDPKQQLSTDSKTTTQGGSGQAGTSQQPPDKKQGKKSTKNGSGG